MNELENQIIDEIKKSGADFIRFVDISNLNIHQNKGFPHAILFGIILTPNYIHEVASSVDYVQSRINNNFDFDDDELYLKEIKTDTISDNISGLIISKGYNAYSQSDRNQIATGLFDGQYGKTALPHKTIAVMAGVGWIGKNNLLVTEDYGCGLCIGVILTDALLATVQFEVVESKCGKCNICLKVCEANALKGCFWINSVSREDMIDVYKCTTCMKCLVHCNYTQKYISKF